MDAASEREPIAGAEAVSYDEERSMVSTEERVHSLSFGQGIAVSNVELRDFSFRAPQEPVTATKAGEGGGGLESYDYPGEFTEPELAERLAQVRLEELSTSRASGAGASDCNRLVPGHCFTLGAPLPGGTPVGAALPGRHPRRGLNQKYLLLAVSHSGSQPQVMGEEGTGGTTEYSNIFEVIPASVEYRPPRVTRRPIALNTHTATVVGPEGEEIYVDKFGRVKVHFHWDREGKHDEKASCWVRVSQDWAGSGYGGMFVPRVGQEVLVSFLEGDPDRPLVTGRVYNGAQSKAYDPQAQRTLSSFKSASSPGGKGSNELSFEDKAGAEKLGFVAQKDNSTVVGDDSTTVIGASRAEEVKGNDEVNVATTSTLLADDVFQEGRSKVTICVGASSITVTPGSITFSSPAIFVGSLDTAIKGGLVRIN
jgi:type VI secretion system secreted protein VgrG